MPCALRIAARTQSSISALKRKLEHLPFLCSSSTRTCRCCGGAERDAEVGTIQEFGEGPNGGVAHGKGPISTPDFGKAVLPNPECLPNPFLGSGRREDSHWWEVSRHGCMVCPATSFSTPKVTSAVVPAENIRLAVPLEQLTHECAQERALTQVPDAATKELMRRTAKPCPQCQALTTKTDGCNFMTCRVCRMNWCWATGKPRHGPNGCGGGHGCH